MFAIVIAHLHLRLFSLKVSRASASPRCFKMSQSPSLFSFSALSPAPGCRFETRLLKRLSRKFLHARLNQTPRCLRQDDWRRLQALPEMQDLLLLPVLVRANVLTEEALTRMSHVRRKDGIAQGCKVEKFKLLEKASNSKDPEFGRHNGKFSVKMLRLLL
jgi:hypothetical protein